RVAAVRIERRAAGRGGESQPNRLVAFPHGVGTDAHLEELLGAVSGVPGEGAGGRREIGGSESAAVRGGPADGHLALDAARTFDRDAGDDVAFDHLVASVVELEHAGPGPVVIAEVVAVAA